MNIFKANRQWATRPADERFSSLADMHAAVANYRAMAKDATVPINSLRVEATGDDIALVGRTGVPATLTNWAAGQMAARIKAPISYLRSLPATLAAQNINHGLKRVGEEDPEKTTNLLFHQNGSLLLRSALSDKYTRIWNSDITSRLMDFVATNPQWTNPLAYENGKFGAELKPGGLYASDHDMFAFLVDESKTLEGSPEGLNRGFFLWNSEVGASSLGFMSFLYDRVCGNNIVWGARNVSEIKVRHIGDADEKAFRNIAIELTKFADSSSSETEAEIRSARRFELGATHAQALDALLSAVTKLRLPELTRERLDEGLATAERREERYGNPYSLWGAIGGLTENTQDMTHTDQRVKVERQAGKLMSIAF